MKVIRESCCIPCLANSETKNEHNDTKIKYKENRKETVQKEPKIRCIQLSGFHFTVMENLILKENER